MGQKQYKIVFLQESFTNYVDKILTFFDHLPTFVDIIYGINVDKKQTFWTTYLPCFVNVVCERPLIRNCPSFFYLNSINLSNYFHKKFVNLNISVPCIILQVIFIEIDGLFDLSRQNMALNCSKNCSQIQITKLVQQVSLSLIEQHNRIKTAKIQPLQVYSAQPMNNSCKM